MESSKSTQPLTATIAEVIKKDDAPKAPTQKVTPANKTKGQPVRLAIPVDEFRSVPLPGIKPAAKLGFCFVKVTAIPGEFDDFMEINPRVPNRSQKGVLTGAVVKGIMSTLRDRPEEMAMKNRGINVLVEEASFERGTGGKGMLVLTLSDTSKHGIVDGGHTYSAIREALESASPEELKNLENAYVRLNILQGIDADLVPEIAEGLNTSKQVDDPSLANLQGEFDAIRKALRGKTGENAVAYHQGDEGEVYISEVLVVLELFNQIRFGEKRHPNSLYSKQNLGLRYFFEDMDASKVMMKGLIEKLPDFLWLSDSIKKLTPAAAKNNGLLFARMKASTKRRAGSNSNKGTFLPFIDETVDYRVPNGWLFPMLASFRANLKWDEAEQKFSWKVPLEKILPEVIDDLVAVCIAEHRDNNARPEFIGKRESAYNQCFAKVQIYLAKRNLLNH